MGDDSPEYGYTCIFHQPNWKLSNMNHQGCLSRATLDLKGVQTTCAGILSKYRFMMSEIDRCDASSRSLSCGWRSIGQDRSDDRQPFGQRSEGRLEIVTVYVELD